METQPTELGERMKLAAMESLKDIVEKWEVPPEMTGALIDAYCAGGLNALDEAQEATMEAFVNWGRKVGMWS